MYALEVRTWSDRLGGRPSQRACDEPAEPPGLHSAAARRLCRGAQRRHCCSALQTSRLDLVVWCRAAGVSPAMSHTINASMNQRSVMCFWLAKIPCMQAGDMWQEQGAVHACTHLEERCTITPQEAAKALIIHLHSRRNSKISGAASQVRRSRNRAGTGQRPTSRPHATGLHCCCSLSAILRGPAPNSLSSSRSLA